MAKFFRDGKIIEPNIVQRFQVASQQINFPTPHLDSVRLQSQLHRKKIKIEKLAHVDLDSIFYDLSRNPTSIFFLKKDCSSPSMWQPGISLANE